MKLTKKSLVLETCEDNISFQLREEGEIEAAIAEADALIEERLEECEEKSWDDKMLAVEKKVEAEKAEDEMLRRLEEEEGRNCCRGEPRLKGEENASRVMREASRQGWRSKKMKEKLSANREKKILAELHAFIKVPIT